ncbi:HNH endonuclease [Sphaerimonospora thailandensis]|uniref:HNH nuclease domain-containing protein n=1 Tax=Sphaerimonospora thailandensis TaxID=795644 RepID=A0A8J3W0N3_9ACTN|nr:HNH endonuclease [Sphaerimonospora thailandensis]GIH71283.1 hypothetical protein Mth01_35360 [Sphaerimonospora thailandensis]
MNPSDLPLHARIKTLLSMVGSLETATSQKTGTDKRHQPLTLVWALGRAAQGEDRLTSWATARQEISGLIRDFGLVDDGPNPEFPILKLTSFGLWDLPGHSNPPPAHGSRATSWMRENQPDSGPIKWVHDIVTNHEDVRAQTAIMLLNKYFKDIDHNALLDRVGLAATDAPLPEGTRVPARRETTTSRVVRDSPLARLIKSMHGHRCQICGDRLQLPNGFYAEGAHIRPLGDPHNGPDTPGNLLCLCPDHHVLFDGGAIRITDDLKVVDVITSDAIGPLRTVPGHIPDKDHLSYRRKIFSA